MNLLFLTYNNYYNRIVKRESTIEAYDKIATNVQEFYDIQFNPNDGVMTEQIVNWPKANDWTPDYLVVYDDMEQPEVAIKSRWFVLEWVRTRGGQYKATLYRDTIADNYDVLMNAPMYVEKATIQQSDDVAIYNKENLEVNQIKQSEDLLQDRTEVPWLVGYFAKNINLTDSSKEDYVDPSIIIPATDVDAMRVSTLSAWEYFQYYDDGVHDFQYYRQAINARVVLNMSVFPQAGANNRATISTDGSVSVSSYGYADFIGSIADMPLGHDNRVNYIRSNVAPAWVNNSGNIVTEAIRVSDFHTDSLKQKLDGQYLYVETGTDAGLYEIEVVTGTATTDTSFYPLKSNFEQYCNSLITDSKFMYERYPDDDRANVQNNITYIPYSIVLHKTSSNTASLTWPVNARKLQDAPYGMFCIPGDSIAIQKNSTVEVGESYNRIEAENIMCTIAEHLGAWCYDIQKLPYCPLNSQGNADDYIGTNKIKIENLVENVDYTYIYKDENIKKGIILFPKFSSFTFDIPKVLTIPRNVLDEHEDTYVEDMKIANQCDFYRMYSPNWAAAFEFNLIKTGEVTTFNVDCTYKPYNPYIHMNPNWSKLYGQDFDDYRGLIVQGDFSIPRVNDAWTQYQINNKNYLNSFNRQVDSIELKHEVAGKMDVFNAVTGTVTGAAAGAATGAKMGGAYGAIAGAVVGGATSAIGGALDVQYNEMLRNDALDLTKDQFNYNLQNIQALPDTLAKVSTFDKNNKIFPVLEYYTCTYQEKVALLNKMIYNGMTIMRIGTLAEFMDSDKHYIKGKLIRCEEIADDFHILTAIAEELNKGVYI